MKLRSNKIQFGYKDVVDYTTIEQVVYDWLVKHREVVVEHKGCPGTFLRDPSSASDEDIAKGKKKWLATLDKIIYSFSNNVPEYEGGFIKGEGHGRMEEGGLTRWNLIPDSQEKWEQYTVARAQHDKKVEAGRKLFAKYFEYLWV